MVLRKFGDPTDFHFSIPVSSIFFKLIGCTCMEDMVKCPSSTSKALNLVLY
jgi:hypothetical protein